MNKLYRFRKLQHREQKILLAAVIELPLMAFVLKLMGFRRVQNILLRFGARKPRNRIGGAPASTVEAQNIEKLVSAAVNEGIYRANCLERSLTLWWLLRREGISSQLKIGVRKAKDKLEAHAWIEVNGSVLNDDPAVQANYSPFTQDIASLHAELQ